MAGQDPKAPKPGLGIGIPGWTKKPTPDVTPTPPSKGDWGVEGFNVSQGDKPKNPAPVPGGGKPAEGGDD